MSGMDPATIWARQASMERTDSLWIYPLAMTRNHATVWAVLAIWKDQHNSVPTRRFFGVCFLLGDKLRSSTTARELDSGDSPAHCVNSICVESATSWCLEGSEVSERTSGVGNSRVSGTGSCTSSSATCESELATEENARPGPRVNTTTSDSGRGVPEEGSEGTRTVSGSLTAAEETSSALLATSKL